MDEAEIVASTRNIGNWQIAFELDERGKPKPQTPTCAPRALTQPDIPLLMSGDATDPSRLAARVRQFEAKCDVVAIRQAIAHIHLQRVHEQAERGSFFSTVLPHRLGVVKSAG